jgi:hypothetical protein
MFKFVGGDQQTKGIYRLEILAEFIKEINSDG